MSYIDIHNSACAAAQQAVDECIKEHGADNSAFLYCGFSWVVIPTKRVNKEERAFSNELKSNNIGSDGIYGGWRVSVYDMVDLGPRLSQSMYLKEIATGAYARYLKDHGISCSSHSRDD